MSKPRGDHFYVPSLDGLRAVAVMLVFVFHIWPQLGIGGFGVTVFFFLSGFLITSLLRLEHDRSGTVSLKHFYLRRVLRIFPPMYLALAFMVVASAVMRAPVDRPTVALQAVHLTNYHMAVGATGHPVGSAVLWSLSVEEHFYLFFPLAYLGLQRLVARPERQAAVLLGVCALILAWRCGFVLGLHGTANYVSYATETRVDSILYGCALALWRNPALPTTPKWPPVGLAIAVGLGLAAIAATMLMRRPELRVTLAYSIHGLALAPIFIAAIQYSERLPWRLLNLAPVRWIGLISYSLYLLHLPIIELCHRYVTASPIPLAGVAFVASVAASTLVYFAVEKPCARLRKRLSHVA